MDKQPNGAPNEVKSKTQSNILTFEDHASYINSIRASALVFEDKKSQELRKSIERLAPSKATVLIRGETGTGKELVAREIHRLSQRHDQPFVAVNCGAIVGSLIESELFGYEKGAFTGAINRKHGWFEQADRGTLFLDEIGDLPISDQVKLLRVLQEQEIVRVGSREPIRIDVRIIAATNVDLKKAVDNGRFREDLYYRLNVAPIELLPLRERKGDIKPLVEHFIQRYSKQLNIDRCSPTKDCIDMLTNYQWPGNIRELENVIHRALLVMDSGVMRANDLNIRSFSDSNHDYQEETRVALNKQRLDAVKRTAHESEFVEFLCRQVSDGKKIKLDDYERDIVEFAYRFNHYNQIKTGVMLGLTRNVVRHKLKKYQLIE